MKLLDIFESNNTTANLSWKIVGSSKVAHFNVGDEQYDIVVGYHTAQLPTRKQLFDVHEISFGRYINGVRTVRKTPSKHPSKVFGIIYNGILELATHEKPEVIVFSAKIVNDDNDPDSLQQRIDLYRSIALRVSQTGLYDFIGQPIRSKHAYNFILFRSGLQITPEELQWIKNNV